MLLALGQLIYSQDQHAAAEHQRFGKVWRRFEKVVSRKRLVAALQDGG
jgi:phage gp16-like protein